jgi:hypothetical protein
VKTTAKIFTLLSLVSFNPLNAQVKFSLATDVSILRNFDGKQSFTVVGQTIHGQWHWDEGNTLYTWFTYHSNGKYKSDLVASARSILTQPQAISFTNNSEMRLRQFSIGFKRYLLGSYNKLEKFNLYGAAGFGVIIGTASNNFSFPVDTLLYTVRNNVINGSGDFKRLSFDLSAGWEMPLAYEIFVFSEARVHIPTTDYPNNYLLKNSNAPFLGSINLGIRILFNNEQ